MSKNSILILVTVACCISFVTAYIVSNAIGVAEKDQVLVWVGHKFTPIHPEKTNITHEFEFDGATRNVERITFITYDYELVRKNSNF